MRNWRGMDENMSPRRASEWLIALGEAPDDLDLRDRLADWIAQSLDHASDWQEMARTYEVMGMTDPAFETDWGAFARSRVQGKAVPLDLPKITVQRRRARQKGIVGRIAAAPRRVIAAAAVAACLMIVSAPDIMLRMKADHITATAESRVLRLADGTVVRLAPQSALAVDYGHRARDVRLLRGEAFFEVTHNPDRPFRVAAAGTTTTVLGTAFDVRLRDHGLEVGVDHGHVRVDYTAVEPHVTQHLRAHEWMQFDWDGRVTRSALPANQAGLRAGGELVAKDMSVADVVDAIRPWFSGLIVVRGERLARQPMTGVYRLADPVSALRAVAGAQGARVQQITPWVLVISEH